MRTAELRGPAIEYWFAKAIGKLDGDWPNTTLVDWIAYGADQPGGMCGVFDFWDTMGPLIHREGISLTADPDYDNEGQFVWRASYYGLTSPDEATPFLAVMRVVMNKTYGDVLPEETQQQKAA